MKHLFTLMTLVLFVGVNQIHAQENQSPTAASEMNTEVAKKKSCSKKCLKTCAAKAEKAAMSDDMIEKRVCENSGSVTYHRKKVCDVSGAISYTEVQYDEASAQFVDFVEADVKASKSKACAKGKKGCCAKKAKAMSAESQAPAVPSEGTN